MQARRKFLQHIASVGSSLLIGPGFYRIYSPKPEVLIACQQYPWHTFFQRESSTWEADLSYSIGQVNASGIKTFEPALASEADANKIKPLLLKHQIQTPSLYVNSELHLLEKVDSSIDQVLRIGKIVKDWGVKIIVTNPSPIRWGGDENKSDAQLIVQAKALDQLGEALRKNGITLAYHSHDSEMRNSAREFHHMMMGTDPENVKLCLDAHWIYRGSGNSQVALFDIVRLYVDRIVELHLRQSQEGIWTEVFCQGDIDYDRLAEVLLSNQKKPHLVLEQAVENGSPNTMNAIKAHRESLGYAKQVFVNFAG
jgi:inosose dehydratase